MDEELQKALREEDWTTVAKIAKRNGAVEHKLTGFSECTLFNSSHAYHDGYDRAHCACGWQSPSGKRKDLPAIFELHARGLA